MCLEMASRDPSASFLRLAWECKLNSSAVSDAGVFPAEFPRKVWEP